MGADGRDRGPESPAERAARWTPRLADPADAPLLRDLALAAGPADARTVVFILSALSGLAFWAADTGRTVTAESLTDPGVIARYEQVGMPGSSFPTRRRARDYLDRVSAAHRGGPAAPRPPGAPKRAYERPYTAPEVDALLRWAQGQPSNLKHHALLSVLALGLGAGLSTADARTVHGTDVSEEPNGRLTVRVGGPHPRLVPVRCRYERLLAGLAATAGGDWLVSPGMLPTRDGGARKEWEEAPKDPNVPGLTLRRCRVTWLCEHLAAGTRLDVLAQAAGLASGHILAQQRVPQLRPEPPADAAAALRDARHPPDPTKPLTGCSLAYTRTEITGLLAWASSHPDPVLRDRLLSTLALGLGLGLRPGEHPHARDTAVTRDPETGAVTLTLNSGPSPRTVPCLREHESLLHHLAATGTLHRAAAAPAIPVGSPPDGLPRLTAKRCRATWTRAQLASGTRLDTLIRAAGLTGPSSLHLEAQALDPPDEQTRNRLLSEP
ncbi:MAG: hypothetical protein H7233_01535 [Pseudorhodobacter sp.]|nr:hypothetical protein [Frankiaceae bacterium]